MSGTPGSSEAGAGAGEHRAFLASLTSEERMLLVLRDELYEGAWDRMTEDLKDRLSGKPYIFKLVNRIESDLQSIGKIRTYETGHDVNLRTLMGADSSGTDTPE